MRPDGRTSRSWSSRLTLLLIVLLSFSIARATARVVLQRRQLSTSDGNTARISNDVSAPQEPIHLWGQCGIVPNQACAEGAQCVRKDKRWSQCRVPLEGSWVPKGKDWNDPPSTEDLIPLWDQCGVVPNQLCTDGAQCMCKDNTWSQCRIPLNGSWFPEGEDWTCTGYPTHSTPSDDMGPESPTDDELPPPPRPTIQSSSGSTQPTDEPVSAPTNPPMSPADDEVPPPPPPTEGSSSGSTQPTNEPVSAPTNPPTSPADDEAPPRPPAIQSPSGSMRLTNEPVFVPTNPPTPLSNQSDIRPNLAGTEAFPTSSKIRPNLAARPSNSTEAPGPFISTLSAVPSDQRPQNASVAAATTSARLSASSSASEPSVAAATSRAQVPLNTSIQIAAPTSSASSSSSVEPSVFANALILPVNLNASSSLPQAIPSSSQSSSISATGTAQPSSTSLPPTLACPAGTTIEGETDEDPEAVAAEACDPNLADPNTNLSSVTPISAEQGDPDKTGYYLDLSEGEDRISRCRNIAAHQYQVCWKILNVTGYVQDWVSFHEEKCNDEDMGFADCFLYVQLNGGANCTAFTGRSQCPSPDARDFIDRWNGAQAYYVAFNIWNIQNWFFTYYLAVDGANALAIDNVGTITRTLDIKEPKEASVLDILAGLAFALGLLSPSGYGALLPRLGERVTGLGAQAPGEYLLRAIQNTPTLSRSLVNPGGITDVNVAISELGSALARIVSQLQTNIQNTLVMVMSNFSLFFDFVHDGFFSTQIENLNTLTQNVTLALNTYLASRALQDDEVIITRGLNTDVNEFQLNGSAIGYDTGCGNGYNEWGMCGQWWYDSTNRISYGLHSLKRMHNNYTEPLESLFNQGLITPELLFMNSQFCADA
ncbi:MAG: hypothetical protein Q9183_004803, partial [Haloplaca sp. 2 TL-2023]